MELWMETSTRWKLVCLPASNVEVESGTHYHNGTGAGCCRGISMECNAKRKSYQPRKWRWCEDELLKWIWSKYGWYPRWCFWIKLPASKVEVVWRNPIVTKLELRRTPLVQNLNSSYAGYWRCDGEYCVYVWSWIFPEPHGKSGRYGKCLCLKIQSG